MPPWNDPLWVPVGLAIGTVGVVLTLLLWYKPRSPKRLPAAHQTVRVEVANSFPVYHQQDGSRDVGEHLIGVTVLNGEAAPIKVLGWGLLLPEGRRMVITRPQTSFEPRMPHWVQPGDQALWFLDADEVRRQRAHIGCKFEQMIAYVSLADGRELKAENGVPLA